MPTNIVTDLPRTDLTEQPAARGLKLSEVPHLRLARTNAYNVPPDC